MVLGKITTTWNFNVFALVIFVWQIHTRNPFKTESAHNNYRMLSVLAVPCWCKAQSQHASQTVLQYGHHPKATVKTSCFIKYVSYTVLHFRNNKLTAQAVQILKLAQIHGLTCIKINNLHLFFSFFPLCSTNEDKCINLL